MPRPVVVTGIGCVSPNGVGCDGFADAMINGRSGLSHLPDDIRQACKSTVAGRLVGFEPTEHMDVQDVRRTPRTVHLATAAAREALAEANVDPVRTGVLLGTGGGGVTFLETQYQALFSGGKTSPFAITVGTHGNLASELSITFGLRGPSHCISTGCASGLDAVGHGLDLIRIGRCDAVLCGGADAPISNATLRAFEAMKVISTRPFDNPADACRPFAADRDGFVLGEGAWMFLLEAADTTTRPPLAEIAGYGSTCDAYHRVQVAPDVAECVRAVRLALDDAGAPADAVDYVNLHGTGTRMNDTLETGAMHQLFGERAADIPMSATKSMIGHPQGASATAGLAATLLCAQRGFVHPTINTQPTDPACDLDYVPEARRADVRLAVVNCLAFGSKNSALVVRLTG
ncbi:MAG: beta-ketoacyl-[acyl-carrier-protein] synthase family protein [Planctomycetota bacterium]